jgi:hypothetical protein
MVVRAQFDHRRSPRHDLRHCPDTPAQWKAFQSVNAEFFYDLGSPGGASAVGKIRKDHPIVAGLPAQR